VIGIVVVSHGHLSSELLAATEHVVGPMEGTCAIAIAPDDDMEARRADILEAAKACDTGAGTVILTDMFGGTPSNLAISVLSKGRIEVIAGVNLPMLIKLAEVRADMKLDEAVASARDAGRKYISVASELLQKND